LNGSAEDAVGHVGINRKSELGQFMTPVSVARFMADLFPALPLHDCRLLDPGAGRGALTNAFLDRWLNNGFSFRHVSVVAFEIDDELRNSLEKNLGQYAKHSRVNTEVQSGDFIELAVDSLAGNMFGRQFPPFTHAVLNPPYKKMGTVSRHRQLLRQVRIETVNLYSAFVALALRMLDDHGHLVAIIPRSFCNGPYYRPFRQMIYENSAIRRLHLFKARDKAFKEDNVLQENVIIHLERGMPQSEVQISTSTDDRFHDCVLHTYPFEQIVFPNDPERFLHIPTAPDDNIIELSMAFRCSLSDLDIQVSTGPVVDFRVRPHIRPMPEEGTVPLLYPCHFSSAQVEWPKPQGKKPNAIVRNNETEKWLYPNGFYTVVRRFSSKEETRRIVANIVYPHAFDASALAFENHLNVFHCRKHGLPEYLAWGLATYLNSTFVDNAFRRFNGHTQVNATDLRMMKYPSRETLVKLGRWALRRREFTQNVIDMKLESIL